MVYEISEDSFLLGKYAEKFSRGKVLDVGCGTGRISIEFAKLNKRVTSLDSSEIMLRYLRKKISSF